MEGSYKRGKKDWEEHSGDYNLQMFTEKKKERKNKRGVSLH